MRGGRVVCVVQVVSTRGQVETKSQGVMPEGKGMAELLALHMEYLPWVRRWWGGGGARSTLRESMQLWVRARTRQEAAQLQERLIYA